MKDTRLLQREMEKHQKRNGKHRNCHPGQSIFPLSIGFSRVYSVFDSTPTYTALRKI